MPKRNNSKDVENHQLYNSIKNSLTSILYRLQHKCISSENFTVQELQVGVRRTDKK